MMKRVRITTEIFENKLKFYQNMSISTEAGNPFDFKNIDVNHAKVKGICFRNCDFSNALFSNASFTDVTFIDCDLTGVKFSSSELANIRIVRGSLDNAQFNRSKIQNTRFDGCRIGTLRIAETKNYGRLRVNNCKVEYLDLGGSAPFEVSYLFLSMTNTDIYMFYAKRVSVKLDNPTNLKIGTLEPHQTSFYPEKAVEVLYSMTDTILPDTQ